MDRQLAVEGLVWVRAESLPKTSAAGDEEIRGAIASFGSFRKLLHGLHEAQEGRMQMILNAAFKLDIFLLNWIACSMPN